MGHINIPIFIPHLGCPNQCIFCNQRYISGTMAFDEQKVVEQIEEVLTTIEGQDAEIAFFGGSFTGIDRSLMIRLLNIAQWYVDSGRVISIRMSTRPDYINEEILDILSAYTISCVELGIQSMNDDVLKYLKRGHTSQDTKDAINLLNKRKIPFVGQMMIGLPTATIEDEIRCAEFICRNGASGARIYPTLVFQQTELAQFTTEGQYIPLTLDEAIFRGAKALKVFVDSRVPCIRIGLCESENLHSNTCFMVGPNHPSIGEMIKSELYYNLISSKIKEGMASKSIIIYCSKGAVSQIVGNKKKNILKLKEQYGIKCIKVCESDALNAYDIKITEKED